METKKDRRVGTHRTDDDLYDKVVMGLLYTFLFVLVVTIGGLTLSYLTRFVYGLIFG